MQTCEIPDCGAPHFGRGYCNRHYWQLIRKPKKEERIAECAWCGVRKPISQMRHPDASRGKTPSTCHACRTEHSELAWCDYHGEPHPRTAFTPINRPIGVGNECVAAASARASQKRGHAPIQCVSCEVVLGSWNFRGGRMKCPTCRDCEAAHPDDHWCVDCATWLPKERFARTGVEGKYLTVRCTPCRTAHSHGVTVKQILERQGSSAPECAACGSQDLLKVDHDHSCCPAARGCEKCVRGYLCHECNTAEGLLRTPERARSLAVYMESRTTSPILE